MRIGISSSGSFNNITSWLTNAPNKSPNRVLKALGNEGVRSLSEFTPIGETGQTSMGWSFVISKSSKQYELAFINRAHPGESVNIAKIIRLGHGTGTGGYVPPNDYITPAMSNIYKTAGDRIAKEMFK